MRTTLTTAAITGLAAAGLAATPAAALDPGPVEMLLADCTAKQSTALVPGCSFLSLKSAKQGGQYVYVNADLRNGTYDGASGALTFPAASQKWPAVTTELFGVKAQLKPTGDVTGTLDGSGKLDLTLPYELDLFGGPTNLDCRLSGTAALTSIGADAFTGQPTGTAFDTATGKFAVVTPTASKITFNDAGACSAVKTFLDPDIETNGLTFHLTGTLFDQTGEVTGPDQKQTADVSLPKKVKPNGKTTLIKRPVFTDTGQAADTKLTWSTKKNAQGKNTKYAKVTETKQGGLVLKTKGKAKKLYVKLTLSAPAIEGYKAYTKTKKWTVTTKTKKKS